MPLGSPFGEMARADEEDGRTDNQKSVNAAFEAYASRSAA